jgi:hypothetical protein
MLRRLGVLAPFVAFAGPALAQDHAIAAKVGALGLGVEYTYTFTELLSLRAAIYGSQYGFRAEESDIEYDFDLNWDSLSVAVDFHPLKSPFRVTLGVLRNDNGLDAQARLSGPTQIGDTTYPPAAIGTLSADVSFDDFSTFVGLGWDWSRKHEHFGLSFDLGLLDQGAPRLGLISDGPLNGVPQFDADLEAERVQLQDDLDSLDLFPFATLGFVYRF